MREKQNVAGSCSFVFLNLKQRKGGKFKAALVHLFPFLPSLRTFDATMQKARMKGDTGGAGCLALFLTPAVVGHE